MKKRSFIYFLIIVLIFTAVGSFTVGCGNNGNSDTGGKDNPDHVRIAEETPYYIVENSHTEYSVVIAEKASPLIKTAENELNYFWEQATGKPLTVITDTQAKATGGKFISIGDNALLEDAGIKVEYDKLGSSGCRVVTKGRNVYLYGGNDRATIYAVYEFLHETLGYEFYYTDCYSLDKNVSDVPLMRYDITEIPDIEYRTTNYGYMNSDAETMLRMRLTSFYDIFVEVNGGSLHNCMNYLPYDEYYSEHPKWFAGKTGLSYCAQGDEKEYKLMVETVAEIMKKELIAQPTKNLITLSISDDMTFDSSPANLALVEKYGSNSASIILFLNDVNKIIREWFAGEGKEWERDLEILFFAYNKAEDAPAEWNESTGSYQGKAGIHCDEGVSVMIAPIFIDYTKSIYHEDNKSYYENMKKWQSVSENMFLWSYSVNFPTMLVPYDNFNGIADLYEVAHSLGVKWMFNQAQIDGQAPASCYGTLKGYLDSKLAWNSQLDIAALTEEFFDNYFGEASSLMKKQFKDLRVYTQYLKDNSSDYSGVFSCQAEILKESLWSKPVLLEWNEQMNQAVESLDMVRLQDPDRYNVLYKHIANERLSVLYMLIELYSYNSPPETVSEWKARWVSDNELIGGTRCISSGDGGSAVGELYTKWGVSV